jgi:hypothetical protein
MSTSHYNNSQENGVEAKPLSPHSIRTNHLLLANRKVLEGRLVAFNSLNEFHVYEQFYAAGWQSFVNLHELVYH